MADHQWYLDLFFSGGQDWVCKECGDHSPSQTGKPADDGCRGKPKAIECEHEIETVDADGHEGYCRICGQEFR